MIKYKIDVLQRLKNAGYTTYRLRKEKILSEATIQKLRNSELVSWGNINVICNILQIQPGDILTHCKDEKEKPV